MWKQWKQETEQIRQMTGLPIDLVCVPSDQWPQIRLEREKDGDEIIHWQEMDDRSVLFVVIPGKSWPDAARTLLSLFFRACREAPADTRANPLADWLRASLHEEIPLPPALERRWIWKEDRLCFLLQRTYLPDQQSQDWFHILGTFFGDRKGQLFSLVPVSDTDSILLVPLSFLPDAEWDRTDRVSSERLDHWLNWAATLHELFAVEAMESVRVIATLPIQQPAELPQRFRQAVAVAGMLKRLRPTIFVAGEWQYSLERWFASLPASLVTQLRQSLSGFFVQPLSDEQRLTLDAFFSHNLNSSETARSLFLHRNTLLYRLEKLKEQTGLDPRLLSDAVLLQLALLIGQSD